MIHQLTRKLVELIIDPQEDGGGNVIFLDRQNVSCKDGEALTKFRLFQDHLVAQLRMSILVANLKKYPKKYPKK